MNSRSYSILWCVTYYLVVAIVYVCLPFVFVPGAFAEKLGAYAIAMPPAYWMINDARLRRLYVPHVVQPAIMLFWYLVVPIYLLRTRGWWGLLYLILHVVGSYLTLRIGYYLSVVLIWPIVFPDSAW